MVKHRPFLIPLKEEFHMSGNHNEPENAVHTGTTTLALKCKDGVVMATDQRATMGNLIANSNVQKVYPISDYIGMTISGLVGDAQLMIRFMKSEIAIYEMEKGARISVQTAATMLGSVIRQGFYLGTSSRALTRPADTSSASTAPAESSRTSTPPPDPVPSSPTVSSRPCTNPASPRTRPSTSPSRASTPPAGATTTPATASSSSTSAPTATSGSARKRSAPA